MPELDQADMFSVPDPAHPSPAWEQQHKARETRPAYCENCRYWTQVDPQRAYLGGTCSRLGITFAFNDSVAEMPDGRNPRRDVLVMHDGVLQTEAKISMSTGYVAFTQARAVITRPDFGCVAHEPKEGRTDE